MSMVWYGTVSMAWIGLDWTGFDMWMDGFMHACMDVWM